MEWCIYVSIYNTAMVFMDRLEVRRFVVLYTFVEFPLQDLDLRSANAVSFHNVNMFQNDDLFLELLNILKIYYVFFYAHIIYNNWLTIICDWLWENPPVTHKDKYLEIHNSIIRSVIYISRRLKAACLQFTTNL